MERFCRQLLSLLITTLFLLTADALELSQNQTNLTGNKTNSIQRNNTNTSVTVKFQCPSKFGYYASANGLDNLTKFWLCVNWEPHEFSCPKGTHFNVHENQCTEWISENSTREDASEVIEHLKHEEEEEEANQHQHQSKHHHKKSHRHHHRHHNQHHKSGRHLHKPHPAVVKELHRQHQQLERMHRRVESLDSRLDSLYAYVDSKLRQSKEQHSTA